MVRRSGSVRWNRGQARSKSWKNCGRTISEQINALTAWPGQSILISGSDDTTVRFWDIAKGCSGELFPRLSIRPSPRPAAYSGLDWVLYTPDGHIPRIDQRHQAGAVPNQRSGATARSVRKDLFNGSALRPVAEQKETPRVTQQPQGSTPGLADRGSSSTGPAASPSPRGPSR